MFMNRLSPGLAALFLFLLCRAVSARELVEIEAVKIKGCIANDKDISALAIVGDHLLIGSDETDRCQILKSTVGGYTLLSDNDVVLADGGKEVDIEAMACEGRRVYVIGSHARVRPKPREEGTYKKNRERIERVRDYASRDLLARFTLTEDGRASSLEKLSLRSAIEANPILGPFARIAANENGVNIEGLAVKNGTVYVGFRSPILRGNYVPVLLCDFDHIDSCRLLFTKLEGLGIRDIAATKDGFLILAGPMGDGPGSFKLFSWNGLDCLPGGKRPDPVGETRELCRIPCEARAKAEAIAVATDNESFYEFLIGYDGLRNGGIKRFRLSRP
jgi:hypothetical protein